MVSRLIVDFLSGHRFSQISTDKYTLNYFLKNVLGDVLFFVKLIFLDHLQKSWSKSSSTA